MTVFLGHLLSLSALLAYAYAAVRYARILVPAGAALPHEPIRPALRLVLGFGLACHLLFLLLEDTSGAAVERFPFALSSISISVVALFLLLEKRYRLSALGAFIAPLALIFMLVSAITFHLPGGQDALFPHNLMLSMHLVCTVFAYTLLVVATGASAAFLVSEASLKRKRHLELARPFPSLVFLERFHRAVILFGFLFLVLGLVTGIVYGEIVGLSRADILGRLRWVFPVVGVYAFLAAAIYPLRMRGRKIAWITLAGSVLLLAALLGAGLLNGSFHLA